MLLPLYHKYMLTSFAIIRNAKASFKNDRLPSSSSPSSSFSSIFFLSDSTAAPPVPAEALARARVLIADAMNFRTTRYRTDAVALKVYAFQVHQGPHGLFGNKWKADWRAR